MSENSLLLLVLLLYNRENNKPRLVWRSCQQRVNCCKPRLGMSSSLEVGRVARSTARERGSVFPLSWRVGRTKLTITQAATWSAHLHKADVTHPSIHGPTRLAKPRLVANPTYEKTRLAGLGSWKTSTRRLSLVEVWCDSLSCFAGRRAPATDWLGDWCADR